MLSSHYFGNIDVGSTATQTATTKTLTSPVMIMHMTGSTIALDSADGTDITLDQTTLQLFYN